MMIRNFKSQAPWLSLPLLLLGMSSSSLATYSCHDPDPTDPDPVCSASWNFAGNSGDDNSNQRETGAVPQTYTTSSVGTSGSVDYELKIRALQIKESTGEVQKTSSIYATDINGYPGIGVHASDEGTDPQANGDPAHWGTKIDNVGAFRDAVLLDFDSCLVSVDQLTLKGAYTGAYADFQLWAWAGDPDVLLDFSGTKLADLPDYDLWDDNTGDWDLVKAYTGKKLNTGSRTIDITGGVESRYFLLLAGNIYNEDDAFRLTDVRIACRHASCGPDPAPGVPVPGTLALLGLGALLGRKRFLKLAA